MLPSDIVSLLKERNIVMFIQYHCHENQTLMIRIVKINLKTFRRPWPLTQLQTRELRFPKEQFKDENLINVVMEIQYPAWWWKLEQFDDGNLINIVGNMVNMVLEIIFAPPRSSRWRRYSTLETTTGNTSTGRGENVKLSDFFYFCFIFSSEFVIEF